MEETSGDATRVTELTAWRHDTQADLDQAQTDLADAQRRVDAARERLTLLDRLLTLEQTESVNVLMHAHIGDQANDLLDSCERIIRAAGRPLHISELLSELKKSGVALPGRGTDANVIVRLRRAQDRFVRTGRGIYGLPEFGLQEVPTTAKKKRRRMARKPRKS